MSSLLTVAFYSLSLAAVNHFFGFELMIIVGFSLCLSELRSKE